jgi:TolB-like protein
MLRLKLFGTFGISGPEGRIVFPSVKLSACLAVLALSGKPARRDEITSLLWGSHFEEQARQNFRQALARIRKSIGSEAISSDDNSVHLSPNFVTSDIQQFEALAALGTPEALREAVSLLDGDFLAGIDLEEPAWEEWLSLARRRLGEKACATLVKLGELELADNRPDEALRHAEACIRRDIFREDAHQLALKALVALGRRSEALRHYQNLAVRLKQELGATPEPETTRIIEPARAASPTKIEEPATTIVARRPSIAVLPFANLSGSAEQDYFIDGMVDEIITALSRFHWLFVIARSSSFTYKGRAVDVKQVGRELGVRYVLEGSVRRAGTRLRISGQLIDASTGTALWADRMEGDIEDVFELQDLVTSQVVGAIAPRLEQLEIERARRKPTASLDAFDHYLRGQAEVVKWTREGNAAATSHFYKACDLDPEFASAFGMAARCYSQKKAMGWMNDPERDGIEVRRLANSAIELGRGDPVALSATGMAIGYVLAEIDAAISLNEESMHLSPNFAQAWYFSGWLRAWRGEADIAIDHISRALILSPHDPNVSNMRRAIALAHFIAGSYEEAISAAEVAAPLPQNAVFGYSTIAAASALIGYQAEAERALATVLNYDPALRLSGLRWRFPMRRDTDFGRWAEGLRRAGLPE